MTSLLTRAAIVATVAAVMAILLLACGSVEPTPDLTPDHRSFGSWRAEATTKAYNARARSNAIGTARAEHTPVPATATVTTAGAVQTAESGGECNPRYVANCSVVRMNKVIRDIPSAESVNRLVSSVTGLYNTRFERPSYLLAIGISEEEFEKVKQGHIASVYAEGRRAWRWMHNAVAACQRVWDMHDEIDDLNVRLAYEFSANQHKVHHHIDHMVQALGFSRVVCTPGTTMSFDSWFEEWAEVFGIENALPTTGR